MKKLILLLVLGIAACEAGDVPTTVAVPTTLDLAIIDATDDAGSPGFFWHRPIASTSPGVQLSVPAALPHLTVTICETDGTACIAPVIRTFSDSGDGSESLRLSDSGEHFIVNWHTRDDELESDPIYRISVSLGARTLGYADVDVVEKMKEAAEIDDEEFVALKDGRTLPIKFSVTPDVVFGPSLIAYYPLEGDGADLSANANPLVVLGGPVAVSDRHGVAGAATFFDGIDDYMLGASIDLLEPFDVGTVSLWFKSTAFDGWFLNYNSETDANSSFGIGVLQSAVGQQLKFAGVTTPSVRTQNPFNDGAWHHLALVADGTNTVLIYVDGVLRSTVHDDRGTAATGSEWFSATTRVTQSAHHVSLGASQDRGLPPTNHLDGVLDDVLIYDRALKPFEITLLCDVSTICS